jgi:secreted trypsin-like serine protease
MSLDFFNFGARLADFANYYNTYTAEYDVYRNQNVPVKGITQYVWGGLASKNFAYPYLVSLQKNGKHHCGGTLIDQNTILTAAHCTVTDLSGVTANVHRHNLLLPAEKEDGQVFNIVKIIKHEEFAKPTFAANDIALWKLEKNCTIESYVKLPEKEVIIDPEQYKEGLIVGWGRSKPQDIFSSNILLQSSVPIKPYDICKKVFSADLSPKNHICAGFVHSKGNACHGDSGGPLFWFDEDGQPIEIGLVSFGSQGDCMNTPVVFTNISKFLDWINKNK